MSFTMPRIPAGSGEHPIALVVVSANDLDASGAFYSRLFGWQLQKMSAELTGVGLPAGPMAALRSNVPGGFPGMVPYIGVREVDSMLARVVTAGGTVERPPWSLPMVGKLARFKDSNGTLYGLTDTIPPAPMPHVPMPIGSNPKPPAGALCHVEMYAADGPAAARVFGELFGWGALATMPQYMAFDPGAGVGGVFQSHTPALPSLAYLYATDVEAKLAEVAAAGGKPVGGPMRLPGVACFGYFKDPSDTMMGLIGP